MKYDYVIRNARIVDGSNAPWFMGNVAVKDGTIAGIERASFDCEKTALGEDYVEADEIIDAKGRVLAPGFIDTHTHLDISPFTFNGSVDLTSTNRLLQGITTQICGCCGISPAPVNKETKQEWMEMTFGIYDADEAKWESFGEYLNALEKEKLGVNFAGYVGHGAIRHCVMGYDDRKATKDEIEKMKALLAESMEGGALGMSTGLIYAPGVFSDKDELIELASVLKEYGGIYASHIRNENARWFESVEEVIEICETNQIPGIIHHLKTKRKDSAIAVDRVLKTIEDARRRGVDVVFDQYPYEASATTLDVVLSSWMHEGGKDAVIARLKDKERFLEYRDSIRRDYGWANIQEEWLGAKNMLIVAADGHPEYKGRFVDEIAESLSMEPIETVFKILLDTDLKAGGAFFGINEEDICTILKNPYGMIGSDSDDVKAGESAHPRTNGTFSHVLKSYVMEKGVISLENAIYKMTGFPAARFGLDGRGLIKQGFIADLVLMDLHTLEDDSTYIKPFGNHRGIDMVFVGGTLAVKDGKPTGKMAGVVAR